MAKGTTQEDIKEKYWTEKGAGKTPPEPIKYKFWIGGLFSSLKVEDVIEIDKATDDKNTKTPPTHIISLTNYDNLYCVSFDGVHVIKATKEQIIDLSKHDLSFINSKYPADDDNAKKLVDLLTLINKYANYWSAEPGKDADKVKAVNSAADTEAENIIRDVPEVNPAYSHILQGALTNNLAHLSSKNFSVNIKADPTKATAIIKGDKYETTYTLQRKEAKEAAETVEKISKLGLSPSVQKVLDMIIMNYSVNAGDDPENIKKIDENREVEISINEYNTLCKTKDRTNARQKLNEAAEILFNISVNHTEQRDVKNKNSKKKTETLTWRTRLFDAVENTAPHVSRGVIRFKLSMDFAKLLSWYNIMEYPNGLFAINMNANPYSFQLGRKLAEYYNINLMKPATREHANRIKVKSLLQAVPDFPTPKEIAATRHPGRAIEAFERDMNALLDNNVLECWEYCDANENPLPDNIVYDYKTWSEWLVLFTFKDYPDKTEYLSQREKKQAAERNKKARQKRKAIKNAIKKNEG